MYISLQVFVVQALAQPKIKQNMLEKFVFEWAYVQNKYCDRTQLPLMTKKLIQHVKSTDQICLIADTLFSMVSYQQFILFFFFIIILIYFFSSIMKKPNL